ncbi:MAG: hypothetical protein HFH64_09030 [Lachnospiraceae bacterium]|nr:hypothetical protein [Lachnospiraceae bacterium]
MLEIFIKKNNGAVTVFLSLILVPVLAFTGVFIDLGRVWLAQGIAASSADLALNTVMTSYDKELNEYYGLAASCQNTEEFIKLSEEYFKKSLNSEIVDEEYLDSLWKKLMISVGNAEEAVTGNSTEWSVDKAANFLLMDAPSDDSVKITKADENSDLANPVFLKAQIVEFMKYRAPIGLAESILEQIKGYKAELNNSEKDKELQKKEEQVYEFEEEFMRTLYDTYKEIKVYEGLAITEDMVNSMINSGSGYRAVYEDVHKRMLKNYAGLDINKYPASTFKYQYALSQFSDTNKPDDITYIKKTIKEAVGQVTIFRKAQEKLITETNNALVNMGLSASVSQIDSTYTVRLVSKIYTNTYKNALEEYNKAADKVFEYYARLESINSAASELVAAETETLKITESGNEKYDEEFVNVDKTYKEHFDKAFEMLKFDYDSYLSEEAWTNAQAAAWSYNKIYMKVLQTVAENSLGNDAVRNLIETQRSIDNNSIKNICNEIKGRLDTLEDAVKSMKKIEEYATKLIQRYDAYLNGKNGKAGYNQWSQYTNTYTYNSDYCDVSKTSLNNDALQIGLEIGEGKKYKITAKNLNAFKNRVTNIRMLLEAVREQVDSMKYAGKKISEIDSVDKMIHQTNAASAVANCIRESEFESAVEFKFESGAGNISMTNDNHPEFSNNPVESNEAYVVYQYIINKFQNMNEEEKKEGEKQYKERKKEKDKASDDVQNIEDNADVNDIKENLKNVADLYPSKLSTSSKGVDLLDGIISIVTDFADYGFKETIERYRDVLYTADYCMEMFSYATYEKEAKYKYMLKEHESNSSKFSGIENLSIKVSFVANEDLKTLGSGYEQEFKNMFTDTNPQNTTNKSLTNKPINASNNYAYTRELEYILFGKSNKENVSEMSQELFGLRYALNLGPGIAKLWNDDILCPISATISGATSGIIPEPLVRMVLVLILIGMESLNDVSLLLAGIPVQFLKIGNDSEWVYSGDYFKGNTTSATRNDNAIRFYYSDYMLLLLFLQLKDTDKSNDVYKRIGDVIQANMSQLITDNKEYQLSKAITQYKMNYTLTVKPLVLNLGVYNEYKNNPAALTEWRTFSGVLVNGY